jgi:hypothetical protein
VIALPPFDAGAVQLSETWPLPGVAVLSVGAPGTVRGVALSAFDGAPWPAALLALTVNEYDVPLARLEIVQLSDPPVEQVFPPGLAVAT